MRFYWPIAKVDAEQRMVWGYASTEAEDDQGETVTRAALAAALDDYMRFANIREMHRLSAVGVATEAAIDDKGLYIGAKIIDADAWEKVIEGVYKGFSIGGRITARDSADRRLITGLRLTEISVVDRPANPEAVFDCWKLSAAPTAAAESRAPMQVWDCGVAGHHHLAKADAQRCLAKAAPEAETADERAGAADEAASIDYADPGYQPDGKRRYPLDSERHIRAAWAFIHQPHNAARYTSAEVEAIKARIVAAWRSRISPDGPPALTASDSARKDAGDLAQRIGRIIADLCELHDALAGDEAGDEDGTGAEPAAADIAASAAARTLRKSAGLQAAESFARLAGDILPRLDALQQRVDEIARTPLPPQTIARGFTALAKREDVSDFGIATDDIAAALARMSAEERTLTLIKAARANPLSPFDRTGALNRR